MSDCIFCKILNGEVPSDFLYEDGECVAFNDIYPKMPVHILIVPKKHIPKVSDIKEGEEQLIGHLVKVANKLAKDRNLEGYKLLFNVGKKGGQEIFHVHLHLMGE